MRLHYRIAAAPFRRNPTPALKYHNPLHHGSPCQALVLNHTTPYTTTTITTTSTPTTYNNTYNTCNRFNYYHSNRHFNDNKTTTNNSDDTTNTVSNENTTDTQTTETTQTTPQATQANSEPLITQTQKDGTEIATNDANQLKISQTDGIESIQVTQTTPDTQLTPNTQDTQDSTSTQDTQKDKKKEEDDSFRKDLRRALVRWMLYLTGIIIPWVIYNYYKTEETRELQALPTYLSHTNDGSLPLRCYFWSNIISNRAISRVLLAPLAEIEIPKFLRKAVYKCYGMIYHVQWDEFKTDLTKYRTFREFFTRPLEYNRELANSLLISPVDGTVLTFGEIDVKNCLENGSEPIIEQIKGVPYYLRHFLGVFDPKYDQNSQKTRQNNEIIDKIDKNDANSEKTGLEWLDSMMSDMNGNKLYYCIIYLGPGDYHRFHSSCHWKCNDINHIVGDLYMVKPSWLKKIPGLFSLNERVVLRGSWDNWVIDERDGSMDSESLFFSYVPIGAFNVGSIVMNFEQSLKTNQKHQDKDVWYYKKNEEESSNGMKEDERKYYFKKYDTSVPIAKGQEIGYFALGSTVAMIFESKDFEFVLKEGEKIRYGDAIGDRKY